MPKSFGEILEAQRLRKIADASRPRESQPADSRPPMSAPTESYPSESQPGEPAEASPRSSPPSRSRPVVSQPTQDRPAPAEVSEGTGRGEWILSNWIPDVLMPSLGAYEQLVMWRVLRLTLGFHRDVCVCSHERMATKLSISRNSVKRAARKLEDEGYVLTRTVAARTGGNQATEWTLLDRGRPPESRPPRSRPPKGGPPSDSAPAAATMKPMKEHGKVSVYDVRNIAARLREVHGGDGLRARVVDALIGQGSAFDDATVDDAIHGMTGEGDSNSALRRP